MKTKSILFLATALSIGGTVSRGADACCAAQPAEPACCAPASTTTDAAVPLTARSIYQLETAWTNDAAASVRLAQFRGRPVVVAMFFASCTYACPLLVTDMQHIRESLPADVRDQTQFVLVSFDTTRDTPAALNAYRARAGLDSAWTLLTGDSSSVQELAMLLGVKFKQDANGQYSHSNLVTVLNGEGEVTHQRNGLMGDVSEISKAVAVALAK